MSIFTWNLGWSKLDKSMYFITSRKTIATNFIRLVDASV